MQISSKTPSQRAWPKRNGEPWPPPTNSSAGSPGKSMKISKSEMKLRMPPDPLLGHGSSPFCRVLSGPKPAPETKVKHDTRDRWDIASFMRCHEISLSSHRCHRVFRSPGSRGVAVACVSSQGHFGSVLQWNRDALSVATSTIKVWLKLNTICICIFSQHVYMQYPTLLYNNRNFTLAVVGVLWNFVLYNPTVVCTVYIGSMSLSLSVAVALTATSSVLMQTIHAAWMRHLNISAQPLPSTSSGSHTRGELPTCSGICQKFQDF